MGMERGTGRVARLAAGPQPQRRRHWQPARSRWRRRVAATCAGRMAPLQVDHSFGHTGKGSGSTARACEFSKRRGTSNRIDPLARSRHEARHPAAAARVARHPPSRMTCKNQRQEACIKARSPREAARNETKNIATKKRCEKWRANEMYKELGGLTVRV